MNSNTFLAEYIIDKNYIYKNLFQELKELLKANEKIKIITSPKYVPIAFQVAKELYSEGLSTYDEALKIERDFKQRKTKIYITLKRKAKIFEYLIGEEYFYKNIFTEIESYLNTNDKVTIAAKPEEVSIAFRVAKELVKKGIACYDEELKLSRNFKEGGHTKVFISLKKRNKSDNKGVSNINIIKKDNHKISDNKNTDKNEKKEAIKELLIENKTSFGEIVGSIRDLLKEKNKIKVVTNNKNIGIAFKAVEDLVKKKEISYDEELVVKRENVNGKGKGKAKIYTSIKKSFISNN